MRIYRTALTWIEIIKIIKLLTNVVIEIIDLRFISTSSSFRYLVLRNVWKVLHGTFLKVAFHIKQNANGSSKYHLLITG